MSKIDEVARLAGVSKGTVSNVFTQKRQVREEVAARVLEVAKELNYKPNYWARTLSTKETRILGLAMLAEQTKFSQFHMSLINGVLQVCYEHGYRLLVNTLASDDSTSGQYVTTAPVDGEIFLDPKQADERFGQRTALDPPAVVIGRPEKSLRDKFSYVDNDNEATAQRVVQYLLGLGHEKVLFLNTSKERTVSEDRQKGYVEGMQRAGIGINPELCHFKEAAMTSVEYGYQILKDRFSRGIHFTAVIVDSDKVALGVYRAAAELGISIPDELSVFAFSDDSVFAPEFHPPLSGVSLNAEELGREAAGLLIERIKDNSTPVVNKIVSSELVVRQSCSKLHVKKSEFIILS